MRKKQKNRKFIIIAIALLLLISIGYAGLSTTLTINGTAKIGATSWSVYFDNVQITEGSVTATQAPTVPAGSTSTTDLTYTVTLENQEDFYEFTVDVVNGGTINAKIADGGVSNTELTEEQSILAKYTVTYSDGTEIKSEDKLAKNGTTGQDRKTIKVRVEYNPDITTEQLNNMGNEDMTLTLNFSLNYVQD